jgi:thiamine biosynthesis lipoprotein
MPSLAAESPAASHSLRAMGTDVTTIIADGQPAAIATVERLFSEWDAMLSRFRPDSELAALNASAGMPHQVGPVLFAAAQAALDAAQASDGLFDPLLARRLEDLGYDRTFDALPAQRIASQPGRDWHPGEWRSMVLDPVRQTVTLPAGTALDLGGIAKGMAVDAALALLIEMGLPYAAVNAGGDLAIHGVPPGQAAWNVAIEGGAHRLVSLHSGALATSSVQRRTWQVGGELRHHLIDPRTGMPARTGLALVSVAAASCRQAEVAAKVALLLGPAAGSDFLERNGLSALLVTERGSEWRIGHWT